MKKIRILTAILTLVAMQSFAQTEVDVLRYSTISPGGTARSMGMANSFGALGADFSTLSNNPAGIALYKKSEFTFTPSLYSATTSSTYMGETHEDFKYNININNIGFVWSIEASEAVKKQGWSKMQIGFGMNRIKNFHNRTMIQGDNPYNSIMNEYWDISAGMSPGNLSDFDTGLAFDVYLLDTLSSSLIDYSVPYNEAVIQRKTITNSGNMKEWLVSFGSNYKDRLYLGATVGLPTFRYEEESIYREFDSEEDQYDIPEFAELKIYDDTKITGSGVNLKLGMIYRVGDFARIGLAVHSPTWYYTVREEFNRTLTAVYDGEKADELNGTYKSSSPTNTINYNLFTPFRAQASAGFIVGKYGVINLDYEFVDYSEGSISARDIVFFEENEAVKSNYKSSQNIRVGAELNLKPIRLRAGYAIQGSPYHVGDNGLKSSISLGVGFKGEDYFFDIAYVQSQVTEEDYLYSPYYVSSVVNKMTAGQVMFTLGFRY